jgi:putative ABC transport system substrate-binding protein
MMRLLVALTVGALLLATPRAPATAQGAGTAPRVGFVVTTTPLSEMTGPEPVHPPTRAFAERLRELGYVEGHTVAIERRSAEGRFERFGDIVAELLQLNVRVIVTTGNEMTRRAKELTATVPIVMAASWSPVENGLVASLARPGGNVTGLTVDSDPEVEAKRLEVLKEAIPRLSRIAFLGMAADWESLEGRSVRRAAQALGVTLLRTEHSPNEYREAFSLMPRGRAEAVFVAKNPPVFAHRHAIVELAATHRVPAMYPTREFVEIGGLLAYGISAADLYRRAATFVDKILKGTRPGDLPVEQPTKFDLVINLRTAKALGLTIPPAVLARADEVIQ